MRIRDWSSDVCSSDLTRRTIMNINRVARNLSLAAIAMACFATPAAAQFFWKPADLHAAPVEGNEPNLGFALPGATQSEYRAALLWSMRAGLNVAALQCQFEPTLLRSEEHTSELPSLMRISYAVFCLKKKKKPTHISI